jgi:transcriptional regulator with XRE-family HTH domain
MTVLKELRRIADWTQTRLSRSTGINRTKLSQAESGDVVLSTAEDAAVRRVLLEAIRVRSERINAVLSETQSESHA